MSRPGFRFLLAHPAHFFACGLGSGLSPVAPGTAGTLFAWGSYLLIRPYFSPLGFGIFLALSFLAGIWACQVTGRALGEPDHGAIVWDEIVPFWMVLFFAPAGWLWQAAAFAFFRLFDITKPWPASYFDSHQKNGFGVMMDDLCAAGFSVLALVLARWAVA